MKRFGQVAVAAVALMASARVASAQLSGIPYGPVETGLGASVSADYGDPKVAGKAYGLTGGVGFSRFGISASAGAVDSGAIGFKTSIGGRFGMKLVGGGLVPITLGVQIGASSTAALVTGGSRTTVILPGAWVKVNPPLIPLKPWGLVYYVAGNSSVTEEVRFTVGANFNLLFGLGVHGAYDQGNSGGTWGVGAHFNFRLPGS